MFRCKHWHTIPLPVILDSNLWLVLLKWSWTGNWWYTEKHFINSQWINDVVIEWYILPQCPLGVKKNEFSVITMCHWSTIDKRKGPIIRNLLEHWSLSQEPYCYWFFSGTLGDSKVVYTTEHSTQGPWALLRLRLEASKHRLGVY